MSAPVPFSFRQLEYFDAIAREGTLAAAAERCRVSPSALALALDELERHLSLQLFVRQRGKGVTLAPAGARLLPHARELLAHAEGFSAQASQSASGLTGRLAIGCFAPLAPFFMAAVRAGFATEHPGLDLEFVEATAPDLRDDLLGGRLDVALMYGIDAGAALSFDPVRSYRPYVVVAADHRLAGQGSVALAELIDEPLVQLDLRPSLQNNERIFAELGLLPRLGPTVTNYELARCLIGRGTGYGVFVQRPASLVSYDGHALASLEIVDDVAPVAVGLARSGGAPRTAKTRALLAHLAAQPPAPGMRGFRGAA